MKNKKIKAVIFDMDGVLIDSPKYVWESFNTIFKKSGFQANKFFIKKHLGTSLRDQLEAISEEFGITYDLEKFSREALEIQLKLMKRELKENKILKELFGELKKMNLKIAVATSSTRDRAEKILEILGIKNRLSIIITAEDVELHKPHPEIYLETAKKLRLNPAECIVVEDAISGIIAGKKANMEVIGLITRFHTKNDLMKEADFVVKNLGGIPKIVEKLNQ